jgi:hypothetical protein
MTEWKEIVEIALRKSEEILKGDGDGVVRR